MNVSPESSGSDPLLSTKVVKAMRRWTAPMDASSNRYSEQFAEYEKYVFRKWIFMAACIVVMLLVMGYALTVGDFDFSFVETYTIVWNHIIGNYTYGDLNDYVVITLRMPRIFMGILAGSGFAVCGAIMQSTLLNPLAEPYTTGVSSGASFGAVLAMTSGVTILSGRYGLIGNAFVFALIPTAVIVGMAKLKKASPTTMIMAGIAVMYIFNAFTTVMMLWADPNDLASIYEWQVGTVSDCGWSDIAIVTPFVIIGLIIALFISRTLNLLSTGDENASSMGINASNMRIICMLVVCFITAAIVSFTGLIGFVGLVAPHIVRLFIGADNRYLVPASALFGAALMIIADTVGRIVMYPSTLQAGVVMAFLGGPMFLWLILRKKNPVW